MARSTLKRRAINQEGTADVMIDKKKKKKNDRKSQAAVAGNTTINNNNASKQTSILSFWSPTTIVTTKNYKKKEKETTMPITNANDESIVCHNRDRFMKTTTTTTTATINQRDSCSDKDSNYSNNNANKIIQNNSSCNHKIKNEEDKNKNKDDCLNTDDDGTTDIKTLKDLSVQNNNDNDNKNSKNKNNNDDDEASDNVDESNTKQEEPGPEQQNIARNNARLASLGLLSSSSTATATNTTMTKTSSRLPQKKRSTIMHHQNAAIRPIRRSSRRNRFSSGSTNDDGVIGDSIIDDDNGSDETKGRKEEKEKEEEEEKECYTVSPLLQYEMTTTGHTTSSETNNNSNNNCPKDEDNNIDTPTVSSFSSSSSSNCLVVKKGPRFIPPKGLNAIYSLDFWKNNNTDINNNNDRNSNSNSSSSSWLVGAGKSGIIALWDTNTTAATIHNTYTSSAVVDDNNNNNNNDIHSFVDPVLYWKGHSGRWIADAKFIPGPIISTPTSSSSTSNNAQPPPPSRLVTAGNDGTVCLWDLSTVSISTGIPKLLNRTGKALHTSGIFCMDVTNYDRSYANNNYNDLMICTGSKDKSIAISSLESITNDATGGTPIWTSRFHTAKVGSVKLQSPISTMLASASDDGSVAIHDYRMNGNTSGGSSSLVAKLENAHARPHSVLWDPYNDSTLVTAGLDPIIKVWDQRNLSEPILCLQGHVPNSTGSRCKKIHRPTFFHPGKKGRRRTTAIENSLLPNIDDSDHPFLLTGGQGSTSVSMYQIDTATANASASLFSRGKLPIDCGNAGCIAVNGNQVAVTVDQGEIIILEPSSTTTSSTTSRS
ncbi:WD40 repeat-like protein [Fragilariopsis cylindrus CCMP1102]|uniref:WD40 repeat-like protein n=1 Tax=Fragilariopsis cylindrus CCMP1102 TaxID=635003 RepID=A0A1E7ESK8_9STRA|nr:WD40 repeat-like protein [Fragilariopsis cylindrus CCMP1102]|eukprot:OEU08827.1 WD40 repeat-like protein [Fragilariopsis cylindrus CCMP1102]